MTNENQPANEPEAEAIDKPRPTARPLRVVRLRPRGTSPGTGYVSPADEAVEWPEDAA